MICERTVKKICCEDISLIENYDKAINDNTQTWDCHHRLETDKNLSRKELISIEMYYNRPASELIFLTPFEHKSLHYKDKPKSEETRKKLSESLKDKPQPWNSYKRSEETKAKMSEAQKRRLPPSEETRKKIGIKSLGNKASTGYKWVHNDKERKMVKPEELEYYLNKGYKLGKKIIW